ALMTYAINATGPFYHGTRADLTPGDLLAPGLCFAQLRSHLHYADRKLSWIDFSGTLDAAIWRCELAKGNSPLPLRGEGPGAQLRFVPPHSVTPAPEPGSRFVAAVETAGAPDQVRGDEGG